MQLPLYKKPFYYSCRGGLIFHLLLAFAMSKTHFSLWESTPGIHFHHTKNSNSRFGGSSLPFYLYEPHSV